MSASLEITLGQFSDRGVKADNQDFYGVLVPREPLLTSKGAAAVIADGISSSEAGALASQCSVKGFLTDYYSTPESWTVKKSVEQVLAALNRWLYGQGQRLHNLPSRGMVTTFSALIVKSTTAHLFHIGDSRIYQVRDHHIEPLTQDHHVWIAENQTYLSRALGAELTLEIDYRTLPVEVGDSYVFTTDGVHGYLQERDILKAVSDNPHNLDAAATRIVGIARANHSQDNLTCQILRIDALPSQDIDSLYRQLTELPLPPPLDAGMILDGYRIVSELHASPTSQLYLAIDQASGRQVVIKTPSVNFEDDPDYLERFLHEEWAGRRVNSPHILKVLAQTRRRRFLYYVMEYLEGVTLRQWMHANPRPCVAEVRAVLVQIVQGLRAFHRQQMLHRDLKPENILIDPAGTVKIIDFGSVKIAGIGEISTPIECSELVGTKNYTAPEYLLGNGGSERSDLFSLGVIAYEMLTGRLPYGEALSRHSTPQTLRRLSYRSARSYREELPVWLDGALAKAVQLDPARRYPVLSEFLYDLLHPNPAFVTRFQPLLERHPVRFWQTLSALLALVCLVLLFLLSRRW